MKIRTFYRLENGVYTASVFTEDWSEQDLRLMQKFGEPEINVGGTLEYSVPEENIEESYKVDDCYRRILHGSPMTRGFDSRDTRYAEAFANLWAESVIGKIGAAFSSLHSRSDGFTRETVHTLSAG